MKSKSTHNTTPLKWVRKRMSQARTSNTVTNAMRFVSSSYLFYLVLGLFAIQALWFATSFYFPMVYDEKFHFDLVNAFTDKWLPYLTNESANINYYRDLSTRGGLLFHYALSFPLRILQFFDISQMWQVITLRYINVAFAIAGLVVFRSVLRQVGLPFAAINLGLLVYALLPLTSYVASMINYDNALFLFFALFTLACSKAVAASKTSIVNNLLIIVIYGCIASLIKLTFLPIFAAGILAVVVVWVKKYSLRGLTDRILQQVSGVRNIGLVTGLLLAVSLVVVVMFSSVYIKNLVLHGSPAPACTKTLSLETCLKSGLEKRNYNAEQTKLDRDVKPLSDYVMFDWLRFMISGYSAIMVSTQDGSDYDVRPVPVIYSATTFGIFIMIASILVGWRYIPRNASMVVASIIALTTVLSLLFFNVQSYYHYHDLFANQPRYLIYIMPLFLTLGIYILHKLLKGAVLVKFTLLLLALILFTQGGGALSYLVRSDASWYFDEPIIRKVNLKLKSTVDPLIKSYTNGP